MCESSEDEAEIDEFENAAEKVKCFGETLMPKTKSEEKTKHNNFIKAILYAIRFDKQGKTDICDKNDFKKTIDENSIDQLDEEKYEFILDLQKFNDNCYEINYVLSKYNYLLRVFESTMKEPKKQNIVRQISSCLTENYSGFQTISIEFARKERKTFKLIDIIYKPTNQKFVCSVIMQKIFQMHIQIFITKKIKQKELVVAMNAIIADNFF